MISLRPKTDAFPRRGPSRSPGSLISRCSADFFGDQSVYAAMRIVLGNFGKATVDHEGDPVDCERSFGNVSRDDYFPLVVGGNCGILRGR